MNTIHAKFAADQLRDLDKRAAKNETAWTGMHFREIAACYRYILAAQKILLMEHWLVTMAKVPAPPDYIARMQRANSQHHGTCELGEDWTKIDAGEKRETIAHELLHLLTSQQDALAMDDVKPHLGTVAYRMHSDAYRRAMEFAHDHISRLVANLLPPYPKVTDGKRRRKRRRS
jgi:hypothetical protein